MNIETCGGIHTDPQMPVILIEPVVTVYHAAGDCDDTQPAFCHVFTLGKRVHTTLL
ncbi:hypothetical protein M378DRAFT_158159 [Amanita muscaria Koide BX008]|uniref:Uncharacterized protein n=1 Tax=Amanita muscaria (strain Koide BX008) TaxID=946122 RepID=A0A0C2TMG4_AMAMK|nr:hypothetical protein M378DRAFT_158159 [Amanita muscaria Koide BX008]